jgi:hypothetical protein
MELERAKSYTNHIMKVLWLFNHPAPYKIDFFNLLGEKVELTVLFERTSESDRSKAFYYEKAKTFQEIFVPGIHLGQHNSVSSYPVHYLKRHPFDIVVINGWSTFCEMKTIAYLQKHNIPYIFAINGGIAKINEPAWIRSLKTRYIPGAKAYLSPDSRSSSYLVFYGADPAKIHLYPYSTVFKKELAEKPLSLEERYALRKKEGIPGNELFVSVGSFIKRKNEMQLLRIWKSQPEDRLLLLIGNGPEKKAYLRYINENHLSNVRLMAYKPHGEILHYFALANASLFLTREDIYGHVVNECLSQGTPVIASGNANAALKLISQEKNGRLVELDSDRAIEKAIEEPFDPAVYDFALAQASQNTIEDMVAAHLAIFEEYLKA